MSNRVGAWYAVDFADELLACQVRPYTVDGLEVAVWRDSIGQIRAHTAFCPHRGAHLGYGGSVLGDVLQCPFHGWQFASNGRLTSPEVPGGLDLGLEAIPVCEARGLVWIWSGPGDERPWVLKDVEPVWASATEVGRRSTSTSVDPLLVLENTVDVEHFLFVHDAVEQPRIESLEVNAHQLNVILRHAGHRRVKRSFSIEFRADGPGAGLAHLDRPVDLLVISAQTPTRLGETQILWRVVARHQDRPARARAARGVFAALCHELDEDLELLQHVNPSRRAPVESSATATFRAWARQFRSAESGTLSDVEHIS